MSEDTNKEQEQEQGQNEDQDHGYLNSDPIQNQQEQPYQPDQPDQSAQPEQPEQPEQDPQEEGQPSIKNDGSVVFKDKNELKSFIQDTFAEQVKLGAFQNKQPTQEIILKDPTARDHERSYDLSEIDESDYLKVPILFFTYTSAYTIWDDKRFGKTIRSPFGRPFRFKIISRYQVKGRSVKERELRTTAGCIIRSKQEAEWMRSHSLYDLTFWEDIGKNQNIDYEFHRKLNEINTQFANMGQHEIVQKARSHGIVMNPDVNKMKRELIAKLAGEALKIDDVKRRPKVYGDVNEAINDSPILTGKNEIKPV